MSRSGYHDDLDPLALGRWRSAVRKAINGKRGQAFLKDMRAALDALPEKRLCRDDLEVPLTGLPFAMQGGDVCAIGAVGKARGVDMANLDPHDADTVAAKFGIAPAMAREIVNENDDWYGDETPERRFARMRAWAESMIRKD